METMSETDRKCRAKKKKQTLLWEKQVEASEALDFDIEEVAMERLQQTIGSVEQQEEELLLVEAKMRQMVSKKTELARQAA